MSTEYAITCTRCSVKVKSFQATEKRLEAKLIKCKGQGEWFAKKPIKVETAQTHVNFSAGALKGLCCYCAYHSGWRLRAFNKRGCLLCKDDIVRYTLFMEIKRSNSFWSELPNCIIIHILQFVVKGNRIVPDKSSITISTKKMSAAAKIND